MKRPVLAEKTYTYLLRSLSVGQWPPGGRMPSVHHLARELKVSPQPVQAAYHMAAHDGLLDVRPKHPTVVMPDAPTRAQAILAARAKGASVKRLALLIDEDFFPLRLSPFQSRLAHEITEAGNKQGYESTIVGVPKQEQIPFAHEIMRHYDAVFVIELRPEQLAIVFALAEHRFPTLLFNRRVPGLPLPSLNTDDHGAQRMLAELLISKGHRNICMLASPRYEFILGEHTPTDTWIEHLRETGVIDDCAMPLLYFKWPDFTTMFDRLLRITPRITGLVLSIPTVLRLMAADPRFSGLRIPEDLSIAATSSAHNIPKPPGFPPITAFEVAWDRAGHCAIEMIEDILHGNPAPRKLRIPLNIALTDSVGPPGC